MKNRAIFKFLAFLLAVILLTGAALSAVGIVALEASDLYYLDFDAYYDSQLSYERRSIAVNILHHYASTQLGGIDDAMYQDIYGTDFSTEHILFDKVAYTIYNADGKIVLSNMPQTANADRVYAIEPSNVQYRALADSNTPGAYQYTWYCQEEDYYCDYWFSTQKLNDYIVHLYVPGYACVMEDTDLLCQALYANRYELIAVLAVCLLGFVGSVVYLCCSAGRSPGREECCAGGLNRMPLDLYAAVAAVVCFCTLVLTDYFLGNIVSTVTPLLVVLGLCCVIISSLVVQSLFILAAQLKTKGNFWLKNTLCWRVLHLIWRILRWIARKFGSVFGLLPLMWQWLLTAFLMGFVPFVMMLVAINNGGFEGLLSVVVFFGIILLDIGIVIYGAYCFGILRTAAQTIRRGNLDCKIATPWLFGSFREMAEDLNSVSEVALQAAQKQLQSERTKTELITNVSHDIKTPLTSIINFVDLLQKPHTPEQEREYLQVLARQSAQMKTLIDDLMELSKASAGSIAVNLEKIDAAEALTQALGEFSDKLAAANLTPVVRKPEHPVYIWGDGRHVWRVISNLLSNAVKYALPGTRLYAQVYRQTDRVVISLKNVSREELRVRPEELLERFVQGDASRNSGGSGLGLNIAKSLMEVQHGALELSLDGDLFKVELSFHSADNS